MSGFWNPQQRKRRQDVAGMLFLCRWNNVAEEKDNLPDNQSAVT